MSLIKYSSIRLIKPDVKDFSTENKLLTASDRNNLKQHS